MEEATYQQVVAQLEALAVLLEGVNDAAIAYRVRLVQKDVQGRLDALAWNTYAALVTARSVSPVARESV